MRRPRRRRWGEPVPGRPSEGRRRPEGEPIETLVNHETNELQIQDLVIPEENLLGKEGMGFYHLLDGLNAERILVAAECVGDGYWFIDKATSYAKQRVVFDKPIGANQGSSSPSPGPTRTSRRQTW